MLAVMSHGEIPGTDTNYLSIWLSFLSVTVVYIAAYTNIGQNTQNMTLCLNQYVF